MSRSAGRVLIIPKGEYSATTQYYMLDLVEYNGCGYVAKQATKGNLPTNTTYWQQMGTTGGGGGDPSTYMLIDGSNAEILKFSEGQTYTIPHVNITKESGENKTVYMTVYVKNDSTKGKQTDLFANEIRAHVDDTFSFSASVGGSNVQYRVVIDAVTGMSVNYTTSDDTISFYGHLETDISDAMSYTDKSISLGQYIADGVDRGISFGYGQTLSNNLSFAGGKQSAAGLNSFAYGDRCVADTRSHAEGLETSAYLNAHAEGKYTSASGDASHAEGTGTIASFANQHAMGKWNYPHSDALFMVGYGTDGANRSNVFEIYNDGSISFDNGANKYKFAKVDGRNGYYDKGGTFHAMEPVELIRQVTLSTTDPVSVSFFSDAITANCRLDVYTNKFGVDPSDVTSYNVGSCVVEFDVAESADTVNVKLVIN